MKLTFNELNLLMKTLSEKQNELANQKNNMQKQEEKNFESEWDFIPSIELQKTKATYYALSKLIEKIENNISIGVE